MCSLSFGVVRQRKEEPRRLQVACQKGVQRKNSLSIRTDLAVFQFLCFRKLHNSSSAFIFRQFLQPMLQLRKLISFAPKRPSSWTVSPTSTLRSSGAGFVTHQGRRFGTSSQAADGPVIRDADSLELFDKVRDPKTGPVVIVSEEPNIHFNLAFETFLMETVRPKVPVFFWWRNDKNVVIGRHQNPWRECELQKMKSDGVALARRFSGGGAVYQDLGNSCFTFLVPGQLQRCQNLNNSVILNVLEKFSVKGEASGRNDLLIEGKKFSGAAFKHLQGDSASPSPEGVADMPPGGLALHHGTLLIDTDLDALSRYLTPNILKLKSKGIGSVAARVVNLATLAPEIAHEALTLPLAEEFRKAYAADGGRVFLPIATISKESECFTQHPRFCEVHAQLTDWDWCYGKTPQFTHRIEHKFPWGLLDANLDVQNGLITQAKLFSDTLNSDLVPLIEKVLKGCPYTASAISDRLRCSASNMRQQETAAAIADVQKLLLEMVA